MGKPVAHQRNRPCLGRTEWRSQTASPSFELCNPPVNAFGVGTQFALAAETEALGRRDDVRVIIIAAVGKGFCAGLDIKEEAAGPGLIVRSPLGDP